MTKRLKSEYLPLDIDEWWTSAAVLRMSADREFGQVQIFLFLLCVQWRKKHLDEPADILRALMPGWCTDADWTRFRTRWLDELFPACDGESGARANLELEQKRARIDGEPDSGEDRRAKDRARKQAQRDAARAARDAAGPSDVRGSSADSPRGHDADANAEVRTQGKEKEVKTETHPSPPAGRVLEVLAALDGSGTAGEVQDRAHAALEAAGFTVDREVPVGDRGDGRRGKVDLRVRAPETWIELDRESPREKSLAKLRGRSGCRIVVLRNAPRALERNVHGVDVVIGLAAADASLTDFGEALLDFWRPRWAEYAKRPYPAMPTTRNDLVDLERIAAGDIVLAQRQAEKLLADPYWREHGMDLRTLCQQWTKLLGKPDAPPAPLPTRREPTRAEREERSAWEVAESRAAERERRPIRLWSDREAALSAGSVA